MCPWALTDEEEFTNVRGRKGTQTVGNAEAKTQGCDSEWRACSPLLWLGNPLLSFRVQPKWEPSHPKYSPLLLGVSQDFVTHLPSPQTCGQGRVLAVERACPQLGVCETTISQQTIQRLREVR